MPSRRTYPFNDSGMRRVREIETESVIVVMSNPSRNITSGRCSRREMRSTRKLGCSRLGSARSKMAKLASISPMPPANTSSIGRLPVASSASGPKARSVKLTRKPGAETSTPSSQPCSSTNEPSGTTGA